jgi:MFS family permease
MALIPLGTAFTFPCVTSLLSRVINRNERGLYMGVQQTFGGLARIIVPLFAGYTYDRFGHSIPFWVSAALVLIGLFVGMGIDDPRKSRRPAGSAAAA